MAEKETSKTEEIISKYNTQSNAKHPTWMDKLPSANTVTSSELIDIDNYYNFYGVMTPSIEVSFLNDENWVDINKLSGSNINQNNFFVSASITDNGARTLNLTLFDRTYYSLQELIFKAIKSAGGVDFSQEENAASTNIGVKDANGNEITNLKFIKTNGSTIKNNLRIKWGYSDYNLDATDTAKYYPNYWDDSDKGSVKHSLRKNNSHRWNERKSIESQVVASRNVGDKDKNGNLLARGNYEEILNQWNQTTLKSSIEEFYITNVQSTLTNTGMQYQITAMGSDAFKLSGFKFLQMYAQLKGTAKELMAFFMNSFNTTDDSLLRVVWNDKNDLINGDEYKKNNNGEYVVNDTKEAESDLTKAQTNLTYYKRLRKFIVNTLACVRKDNNNTLQEDCFGNKGIDYDKILNAENYTSDLTVTKRGIIDIMMAFEDGKNGDKYFKIGNLDLEEKQFKKDNKEKNVAFLQTLLKNYYLYTNGNNKDGGSDNYTKFSAASGKRLLLIGALSSVSDGVDFTKAEKAIEQFKTDDLSKVLDNLKALRDDFTPYANRVYDFSDFSNWGTFYSDKIFLNIKTNFDNYRETAYNKILEQAEKYNLTEKKRDAVKKIIDEELKNIKESNTVYNNVRSLLSPNDDGTYKATNYLTKMVNQYVYSNFGAYKNDDDDDDSWVYNTLNQYFGNCDNSKFSVFVENFNKYDSGYNTANTLLNSINASAYSDKLNIAKEVDTFLNNVYKTFMKDCESEVLEQTWEDCYHQKCFTKNGVEFKGTKPIVSDDKMTLTQIISSFRGSSHCLYSTLSEGCGDSNFSSIKSYCNNIYSAIKNIIKALENEIEGFNNNISKGKTEQYILGKVSKYVVDCLDDSKVKLYNLIESNKNGGTNYSEGLTFARDLWNACYEALDGTQDSFDSTVEKQVTKSKDILEKLDKDIKEYEKLINDLAKKGDDGLITLILGGEEAKANYLENSDGKGSKYYKTISSLFNSYVAQCPPYKKIEKRIIDGKNVFVDADVDSAQTSYKTSDENGDETVVEVENQETNRRLGWTIVGYDGDRPIVGFHYLMPKKFEKIRRYCWGTANPNAHCVKNVSIQNSSEFGMMNMAVVVNKNEGTVNRTDSDGTSINANQYYVKDVAFANNVVTTAAEKERLASKMINSVKKGTIEILGDPSLRFQGEVQPYVYPIYLDIKLQNDGSWSGDEKGYTKCQLSGYYLVSQITHNISSSGYTTTLEVLSYPNLAKDVKG